MGSGHCGDGRTKLMPEQRMATAQELQISIIRLILENNRLKRENDELRRQLGNLTISGPETDTAHPARNGDPAAR